MHSDGVVDLSQSTSDSFFEDEGTSSPTLSEDGGRFDFDENLPKRVSKRKGELKESLKGSSTGKGC